MISMSRILSAFLSGFLALWDEFQKPTQGVGVIAGNSRRAMKFRSAKKKPSRVFGFENIS